MTETKPQGNPTELKRELWFSTDIYAKWNKGKDSFTLIAPYEFTLNGEAHAIPIGFVCNGASIPNWLHSVLFISPFHYTVRRAALIHDYLYATGYNRKAADEAYSVICRADGANLVQTKSMYYALRAFGMWAYKACKEAGNE